MISKSNSLYYKRKKIKLSTLVKVPIGFREVALPHHQRIGRDEGRYGGGARGREYIHF